MSNIGGFDNDPFGSGDSWYADDVENAHSQASIGQATSSDASGIATPPPLRDDWSAQLYVSGRPDRPTNLSEADALMNHFAELNQQGKIDSQTYYHLSNAIGMQGQHMRNEATTSARAQGTSASSGPRADPSTQAAAQRAVAKGASSAETAETYGITHPDDRAILDRIEGLRKSTSSE